MKPRRERCCARDWHFHARLCPSTCTSSVEPRRTWHRGNAARWPAGSCRNYPGHVVDVHGIVADERHHNAVRHLLDRAAQHLDGAHPLCDVSRGRQVVRRGAAQEHTSSQPLRGLTTELFREKTCEHVPSLDAEATFLAHVFSRDLGRSQNTFPMTRRGACFLKTLT